MYLLLRRLCSEAKRSDIRTCACYCMNKGTCKSDKSQEEDHARLRDDTKLQLKQPILKCILKCMHCTCPAIAALI